MFFCLHTQSYENNVTSVMYVLMAVAHNRGQAEVVGSDGKSRGTGRNKVYILTYYISYLSHGNDKM